MNHAGTDRILTEPQLPWSQYEGSHIVLGRTERVQVSVRYLSEVSYMRCGWQTAGISTVPIWVSQPHPRDARGRTCVVGLEATARTDSSYNIMAQCMKDNARKQVTYVPLVFPDFRSESCFRLFKRFLQKGLVDNGIAEVSLKVIQSREDSGYVFPVSLRVDRFIAQMRQTFRSAVGDQFLDGRLPRKQKLSIP